MRVFLAILTFSLKVAAAAPLFDYQIKCSNPYDCHPSVGGLLSRTGMCTTFLVAKDMVGTNKHCLPEDLQKDGADCSGKFEIVFPASEKFKTERLGCKQIVSVSSQKLGGLTPDYAFIRLAKNSERPPLKIDNNGVLDGESLQMWVIKFYSKEGLLHTIRCSVVLGAFTNPYSKTAKSPLIVLKNCPIVKGNSGSPIVDAKNNIRGVVSVYEEIAGSTRFGGGYNFSCLKMPALGLNGPLPKDCDVVFSSEKELAMKAEQFQKLSEALSHKIQTQINAKLKDFLVKEAVEIQFGVRRKCVDDTKNIAFANCRFEIEPHCFITEAVRKLKGPERVFQTEFPYWQARLFLDDSLKAKDELKEGSVRYNWKYQILKNPKMLEVVREASGRREIFKIFACPRM